MVENAGCIDASAAISAGQGLGKGSEKRSVTDICGDRPQLGCSACLIGQPRILAWDMQINDNACSLARSLHEKKTYSSLVVVWLSNREKSLKSERGLTLEMSNSGHIKPLSQKTPRYDLRCPQTKRLVCRRCSAHFAIFTLMTMCYAMRNYQTSQRNFFINSDAIRRVVLRGSSLSHVTPHCDLFSPSYKRVKVHLG